LVFNFKSPEIEDLYWDLLRSTTGNEPCYDVKNLSPNETRFRGEAIADMYVESWTGKNISKKVAEELCAGCDVLEKCGAYALAAQERTGIWGGLRPIDRGIKSKGVTL
jgi:hypothetical protein